MTIERLLAFGDAWNRRDVDDIMPPFITPFHPRFLAGPSGPSGGASTQKSPPQDRNYFANVSPCVEVCRGQATVT